MVYILILLVLAIGFYEGMRNGLMNQLISLIIYCIGFWLSLYMSPPLAERIELLVPYPSPSWHDAFYFYGADLAYDLDKSFYNLLAFIIIFVGFWALSKFIIYILEPSYKTIMNQKTDLAVSGLISMLQAYFILFILLFLMSTMAIGGIQSMFENNLFARWIVEHTPFFSNFFYNHWILPAT